MRVVVYQIEKHEKVIYNLGVLLDKLCLSGKKIGILCDKDNINDIDKCLWTFSTHAFLPHNVATHQAEPDINTKENDIQPVLLTDDAVDIVNRGVICVLSLEDIKTLSTALANMDNVNEDCEIEKDIIYITYDNIVDDIKNIFPLAQIDVYKKTNGKWQRGQFWFDNKTGKVLYY